MGHAGSAAGNDRTKLDPVEPRRAGWILLPTRGIVTHMTLSARNRLEGKVLEIEYGGVMAHVIVQVGKNLIESVITKRSADEMKLKVGDTVSAVIKSTEVMLEKT